MTYEVAIKEAKIQIDVYENMILYCTYFEPKEDTSKYEYKIEFLKAAIEAFEQTRWIPVTERLPENEKEVEITYTSKHWKTGEPLYFTCRAFYTDGTMNTEDSNYAWNEKYNWEYNENLDAYIIPEGWWEVVSFAEEFSCIDQPVVAWMPLPEPYKAGDSE